MAAWGGGGAGTCWLRCLGATLLVLASAGAGPAGAQEAGEPLVTSFDVGLAYDDNVARGKDDERRRPDSVLNVNLNMRRFYAIDENSRWVVTWFAGADAFLEYTRLGRVFGGAKAEYQYRPSAAFDAPTQALFAQFSGDQYDSAVRRGYRIALGASVLLPITDRILLFGAYTHSRRDAKSAVFDSAENSLRVNLDYGLSRSGTLYLGAEYRAGDIVSSGPASLANLDIAKWLVRDDAFSDGQVFAYRFEGQTVIATTGYNFAFDTNNAVDFALRYAVSRPDDMPAFAGAVRARYEVGQFFAAYLRSF
jgi:hypothetical protein